MPLLLLLLAVVVLLLLPEEEEEEDDFLNKGTELTTQKYSTKRGTFSLSRALDNFVMRRRVSADPPGLLLWMMLPLWVRARFRSSLTIMVAVVVVLIDGNPSWLDVRVRARSGPPPPLLLLLSMK